MLKTGTLVDATIIAAPSWTKNKDGERDPEMDQTKRGNAWHSGMKARIGVDAESGLAHTVIGTAANVHDVTQAGALLNGEADTVFADAAFEDDRAQYLGRAAAGSARRVFPSIEHQARVRPPWMSRPGIPASALAADLQHQSAGAAERRDQAQDQRRGHLPQRRLDHATGRRNDAGAERRVEPEPPLHAA